MPDNRWNIAARSKRPGRLGLFYQANPLISVEEILIIHAVQRIELVLSAHATIQRLAIAPELDILQAAGNAAIPVGVGYWRLLGKHRRNCMLPKTKVVSL